MGQYDKFNEAEKALMPSIEADIGFDHEPQQEALPDECKSLSDEITLLGSALDTLTERLEFVLSDRLKDERCQVPLPEFGPARSDSSCMIRDLRVRVLFQINSIEALIQRLDL